MISADYYKQKSDLEITTAQELIGTMNSNQKGRVFYIKSSAAEDILRILLEADSKKFSGSLFILHGDDATVSNITARGIKSQGHQIKSVNWLGDTSVVQPLPIGLPTFERLSRVSKKEFDKYMETIANISTSSGERDIYLYANFDITTNLPMRKVALLAALRLKDSYSPIHRIGINQNLEILSRSKFVLSPPGAGPDCFRTWEAIYLGAIPIVLRSHWPFNHLDLPVLIVDSFENLDQDIAKYENNPPNADENWEEYFRLP